MTLREGDRVEYVGDDEPGLYRGHPGQLWHQCSLPAVNVVSFVNGPSFDFESTEDLRPLDLDEYVRRGRRLVAGLHPLEEREVPRFIAEGQEWPEGEEPTGP